MTTAAAPFDPVAWLTFAEAAGITVYLVERPGHPAAVAIDGAPMALRLGIIRRYVGGDLRHEDVAVEGLRAPAALLRDQGLVSSAVDTGTVLLTVTE